MQTPGHHPGHTEPKPTFSDLQWTYTWPSSDNIIYKVQTALFSFFFFKVKENYIISTNRTYHLLYSLIKPSFTYFQ